MDPRHDDQPHSTGKGFIFIAALAAMLLVALRLCDDTRFMREHDRPAVEARR